MKHTFDIKSLVFGAFLGASIILSVAAATTGGSTVSEYKIISGRLSQTDHPLGLQLSQAATEGWQVMLTGSDDGYPFIIMRKSR